MPDLNRRTFLQTVALGAVATATGAEATQPPNPGEPAFEFQQPGIPHPLDPLTAREIEAVSRILLGAGKTDRASRYWTITLQEPPKEGAAAGAGGRGRRALAVSYQPGAGTTSEHVVDLGSGAVVESREAPGCRPGPLTEEYDRAVAVAMASPEFQQAMAKRGIRDLSRIFLEVWSPGPLAAGDAPLANTGRILRALPYLADRAATLYARPIEGIIVTVDMRRRDAQGAQGAVVHVLDTGAVPLPPTGVPPRAGAGAGGAGAAGRRFTVRGTQVAWGPWLFRVAMTDREGLVMYDVSARDGDRMRSVLYRASVSEMAAFYGDPSRGWAWRNAFDEGDYGLGRTSVALHAGAEVPAGALLLDAVINDDQGKPKPLKDRIGLYERDAGILWTHTEGPDGPASTRRATELVVQSIATVGNYDYVFNWIFAEDGRLAFRLDLTGILLAKGVQEARCALCEQPADPNGRILTGEAACGMQVAPHLSAIYHQHMVNMRLDFDIDGPRNAVRELEVVALPQGADNPLGNAMTVKETALLTEKAARRDLAPLRYWKVINPERPGPLGHYPGYMIHPDHQAGALPRPDNACGAMAGFLDHAFWATKRRDGENFAGGFYMDTERRQGLPEWSERDERIEGEDLVVWYTFGVTHIPRAEEWPLMPAAHAGFTLVPHNFFEVNPAYG